MCRLKNEFSNWRIDRALRRTASQISLLTFHFALFAICVVTSAAFAEGEPRADATTPPKPAQDTISPAYDWKTLPYTWEEIRSGKFPITPVHWQRHADNPVVPVGMNSRPIRWDDDTVRVYYGVRGPGKGIFYFDVGVDTPEKIRSGPHGPIVKTGPKGSYDEDWLIAPEVVRLSDSHLRMYYSAKRSGGAFFGRVWTLAAADSRDGGKTWKKYAKNPILRTTDDKWESGAVGFCSVEQTDDGWKMWYLGTDTVAIKQIGYATSDDGYTWRRHPGNPVIPVDPANRWESGAVAVPRVIRDGQLYKVWYCCYEKNNTYAIGFAESADGIHWSRSPHNPVMLASKTGWGNQMAAYPGTIKVGERYLMWYSGNGYGNRGIGLSTAATPRGTWLFRTGPTEKPETKWADWKSVAQQKEEPSRDGFIQFAVKVGQ